jgi:acyl carrier protein
MTTPTSETEVGEIQHWLVQTCAELCGADDVGPDADFFDLGGNSLTSVKLLARVEQRFGARVLRPEVLFADGRLNTLALAMSEVLAQRGASRSAAASE